jgi:hypothetical protein
MDGSQPVAHRGRETQLLLVTIGVSIGVLLLLSRFRFPERAAEPPATPAAAPLERLAARAAYDELASTMADLERRLTGPVAVLPVSPQREGRFAVAPRVTPDRAIALLREDETLPGESASTSRIISRDRAGEWAVIGVPHDADAVVLARVGPPRPGPRYVVAVEGTANALTLRPVYVGRTALVQDERTSTPLLSLSGLQDEVPRGAAIFSLDGTFIGLVAGGGGSTITVIPGDFLKEVAASATAAAERRRGHLGIRVEALTESLGRATGATVGVIVNDVIHPGPAVGVLLPGDVIQSIGGAPVTTVGDFRRAEEAITPSQTVSVSILRRRAAEQVTVRAADSLAMTAPAPVDVPGFVLRPVEGSGIEVVAIDAGTPAARAGLQRGDLIVAIDGRAAEDVSGLMRAFSGAPVGGAWVLTVHRGLQRHTLALEKR